MAIFFAIVQKCLISFSDIFPTVQAGNPYDTSKPEDQYHIIATETGNVFIWM